MTATEAEGETEAETEAADRRRKLLEVIGVVLIALTAICTAWSAFESSKWGGVMSIDFSEANAARTESVRQSNLANRQITIDVGLFTDYADAVAQNDTKLADFLHQRFPERLIVATDAWLATKPLVSPDAPGTPFEMPQYRLEASDRANELEATANMRSRQARQANQQGDNYTIMSVFFATVILLSALSAKSESARLQVALLVGAFVLFFATIAIIASFPVQV